MPVASRIGRRSSLRMLLTAFALASFLLMALPVTGEAAPSPNPQLASVLARYGSLAGAEVFDLTHGRYYSYNANGSFTTASSIKVPIMLTVLSRAERQRRSVTGWELSQLTAMIEHSNNNAASALWWEVGGANGVAAYLHSIGIWGIWTNPWAWGYSTATPAAMVHLLTLLDTGRILTYRDRSLALRLMSNIEWDQRMGVGDTAPRGAWVAMKDGWVIGPDGRWADNSSGIVARGGEVYIISVYTRHNTSLGSGWWIVRQACAAAAQHLD